MDGEIQITFDINNDDIVDDNVQVQVDNETCQCFTTASEDVPDNETTTTCECLSEGLRGTSLATTHYCAVLKIPRAAPSVYNNGRKTKLRTSKDVYDRLKWDMEPIFIKPRNEVEAQEPLDITSVYIGYKDRFLGICELPFEEFTPGEDIPFHRLYYFRTGGPPIEPYIGQGGEVKVREDNLPEGSVFIWDRESRTDLMFNSGNSTNKIVNRHAKCTS